MALNNKGKKRPWVLLKMARPLAPRSAMGAPATGFARTVDCSRYCGDLALEESPDQRELSWERTSQDIFWELVQTVRHRCLSRLRPGDHFRRTRRGDSLIRQEVKTNLPSSAPYFSIRKSSNACGGEGIFLGEMIRNTPPCLTAALAHQWMAISQNPSPIFPQRDPGA